MTVMTADIRLQAESYDTKEREERKDMQ